MLKNPMSLAMLTLAVSLAGCSSASPSGSTASAEHTATAKQADTIDWPNVPLSVAHVGGTATVFPGYVNFLDTGLNSHCSYNPVILVGGLDVNGVPTSTVEVYDFFTDKSYALQIYFSPAARTQHAAVALMDPSGNGNGVGLLIAGGVEAGGGPADPAQFLSVQSTPIGSAGGCATAGWIGETWTALPGAWPHSISPQMFQLPATSGGTTNTVVLISGDTTATDEFTYGVSDGIISGAAWAAGPDMNYAHGSGFTLTQPTPWGLLDPTAPVALIVGGVAPNGLTIRGVDEWVNGSWSNAAPLIDLYGMQDPNGAPGNVYWQHGMGYHTGFYLPAGLQEPEFFTQRFTKGAYVVAGGFMDTGYPSDATQVYDIATNTWYSSGNDATVPALNTARAMLSTFPNWWWSPAAGLVFGGVVCTPGDCLPITVPPSQNCYDPPWGPCINNPGYNYYPGTNTEEFFIIPSDGTTGSWSVLQDTMNDQRIDHMTVWNPGAGVPGDPTEVFYWAHFGGVANCYFPYTGGDESPMNACWYVGSAGGYYQYWSNQDAEEYYVPLQ